MCTWLLSYTEDLPWHKTSTEKKQHTSEVFFPFLLAAFCISTKQSQYKWGNPSYRRCNSITDRFFFFLEEQDKVPCEGKKSFYIQTLRLSVFILFLRFTKKRLGNVRIRRKNFMEIQQMKNLTHTYIHTNSQNLLCIRGWRWAVTWQSLVSGQTEKKDLEENNRNSRDSW